MFAAMAQTIILLSFKSLGRSAMTQIDQAAQLAVGDVALVDAARPVTYLSRFRSPQWLTLRLPRNRCGLTLISSRKVVLAGKERAPVVCSSTSFVMPIWKPRHRPPISTCSSRSMTSSVRCLRRPDPQPVSRCCRQADSRASVGAIKDGFFRSGFRTGRGSCRSGHLVALRAKASHRARHDLRRIDLFASA